MKKKLISYILVILIIAMVFPSTALATDQQTPARASDYLSAYTAYAYADGGGDVSIWFEVTGKGTMDEIGALTIIVQESSNASTWSNVQTYSHTNYTNMLETDRSTWISSVSYAGTSNLYYRAYVTIWAGKNGGGDSRELLTTAVRA